MSLLQSVSYETDRFGRSSTNLSPSGFGVILVFAGLGFWCFYLTAAVIVLSAKQNPNQVGWHTVLRVLAVFIIYTLPALGTYRVGKWLGRFCSHWARRFQGSPDPIAEINAS